MSPAQSDFWNTLQNLRLIAERLGPAPVGSENSRGENQIILNGLHVVAFAALEDFIRRRTHEVISWLGDNDVIFEKFPETLQMLILQGTIEGVSFSLDRIDKKERVTLLQLQGLLLGAAGEKQKFVPSEFFFGRAASNLSKGNLTSLLEAMGVEEKANSLSVVASLVGMRHLGAVEEIFTRLAKNRHSAAHAFSGNYKLSEYRTDMGAAMPFFAFAFDTAISQCAYSMRKQVVVDNASYHGFSVAKIPVRVLDFNLVESRWIELRNNNPSTKLKKGEIAARMEKFRKGEIGRGDTILKRGANGVIDEWVQPLR